jgi:glycosyltransferase involved in cell wall biosynthesis
MIEKKALFVISGLRPGGTERVFVNVVNNIGARIKPVVVVLESKEGLAYDIKGDLEVYYLYKKNRWDVFRLIIRLSSIMRKERPESIISFGYYANQLVIFARCISGLKMPVCISERTDTASSLKKMNFQVVRRLLLKITYSMADKIIAVSKGTKNSLVNHFGMREARVIVIYNPVDLDKIRVLFSERVDHPWFTEKGVLIIIAVGRFVNQKGFPHLVKAFSMVVNKIRMARLVILGEGSERQRLENLVLELGLKDKVNLLGYQQNPYKFMAKSYLFVLSSLYEGFPNVVLEAMACGVPVIATSCPSGPEEIITDGINGYLVAVGDVDALAGAILKLLKDDSLRRLLAENGRKRVEDFRLEKMVAEYERALEEMACG